MGDSARQCRGPPRCWVRPAARDRKSTRLNSSHGYISYAVFCLKKKKNNHPVVDIELVDPRYASLLLLEQLFIYFVVFLGSRIAPRRTLGSFGVLRASCYIEASR